MKSTDPSIVLEYQIYTQPLKLWQALTELDQMKIWFFDTIPDFKAEVGFETEFLIQVEDRKYTHQWKIVEVIPLKKIKYSWKYEEYPGDTFLTFELIEDKGILKLKLIVDSIESFPDNIPEFSRASCIQGWNYFIGENLRNYLID